MLTLFLIQILDTIIDLASKDQENHNTKFTLGYYIQKMFCQFKSHFVQNASFISWNEPDLVELEKV